MSNLKEMFRDLEKKTLDSLRSAVLNSKSESRHTNSPSIDVNVFDYTELVIVDDELTFLDEYGQHYSLYNGDCHLEDLIDILSHHNIQTKDMTKNEKALENLKNLDIDATIENGTVYIVIGDSSFEISQYEIDYQAKEFDNDQND